MKRILVYCLTVLLAALAAACAPAQERAAAVDVAGIHTRVAGTMFAAIPSPTGTPSPTAMVMPPAEQTPQAVQTPPAAPSPTLEILRVPTMENVPTLTGYSLPGIRVLEQPAAVTRDGITLAVEQVIVYAERIELVYTVRDIPHPVMHEPFNDDLAFSCGGPESYANLVLPDGTVIYPENYLLDGKAYGTMEDFARGYLIHLYRAALPAEVSEITFSLNCLELAHLERAPRNWEVPFHIAPAR